MKIFKNITSFKYNQNFIRWFWFVVETLVSAFVGALIAFIFGSHYWAALVAFGILIGFLVILSVFLIIIENKVSVLSILNQGLKDGKYEYVIKFGSAMRTTLFTSNKNEDIIVLGKKIDEAASMIESAHYNRSKGDYRVTVEGKDRTITLIRIGIKIDDLGWSMHLCKQDSEAVANIVDGIRRARSEALRLSKPKEKKDYNILIQYVELILRGYRHLSGIFYEDVNEHWRAVFYENITRLIMSNKKIISTGGVCESRIIEKHDTICGLFCKLSAIEKANCVRRNILKAYCEFEIIDEGCSTAAYDIYNFLNTSQVGLMSEIEINNDIFLFSLLSQETKKSMVKEQCYAWSRNMVKKIKNGMYKQGEYDFISDEEISCKVAESIAFAKSYYYGTDEPIADDDFDTIISKDIVGKSELRYLSLTNEIELVNLFQPINQSINKHDSESEDGRNVKVEKLISRLSATRELCRDKRADLYVRNSIHLMSAYYLEYNINHRYSNSELLDSSNKAKVKILKQYRNKIKDIYKEINEYEHRTNEDLEAKYKHIMKELDFAKSILLKKIKKIKTKTSDSIILKFESIDPHVYQNHQKFGLIKSAVHSFEDNEIKRVQRKWGIS